MNNKEQILTFCNKRCKGTLMETLCIEFVDVNIEKNTLTARMPVNSKVHQPMGILHGGATMALAETVGSAASQIFCNEENTTHNYGLEISGNHIKTVKEGYVYATAKSIHMGRTTQVWNIQIRNESKEIISHCKLLTISISKK